MVDSVVGGDPLHHIQPAGGISDGRQPNPVFPEAHRKEVFREVHVVGERGIIVPVGAASELERFKIACDEVDGSLVNVNICDSSP